MGEKKKSFQSIQKPPQSKWKCNTFEKLEELYSIPRKLFDYFSEISQEEWSCYDSFVAKEFDGIEGARFIRFLVDLTNKFVFESPDKLQKFISALSENTLSRGESDYLLKDIGITDQNVLDWFWGLRDIFPESTLHVLSSERYKKDPHLILSAYTYLFNIREAIDEFIDDLMCVFQNDLYSDIIDESEDKKQDKDVENYYGYFDT